MRRRELYSTLAVALASPLAVAQPGRAASASAGYLVAARRRFRAWLRSLEQPGSQGLYPYMARAGGEHLSGLSPMASADVAVWALGIGDIELAVQVATGLVHWQRKVERLLPARVHGGLPSDLPRDGQGWKAGDAFYAGDNLVCMAALARTYAASAMDEFAVAALKIARWMRGTLMDGRRAGVWARNYGPPMHYMTAAGAFDNAIHTAVDYLWLGALREVDVLDPQGGWAGMEREAAGFLAAAQSPHGSWYSFFRPEHARAAAGRWYWYRGTDVTIGDDGLRATLAALRYGRNDQVAAHMKWLQPVDGTYVNGYLDPRTGRAKFLPGDTPYFDLVCTGLLRTLHERLGQPETAARCEAALLRWQAQDGGWHWGRRQSDFQPLQDERAVITGVWAVGTPL
jgi:hypothetical protein